MSNFEIVYNLLNEIETSRELSKIEENLRERTKALIDFQEVQNKFNEDQKAFNEKMKALTEAGE